MQKTGPELYVSVRAVFQLQGPGNQLLYIVSISLEKLSCFALSPEQISLEHCIYIHLSDNFVKTNKHKDPSGIWLFHTYIVSCGSSFRSTPHQSLTNCVIVVTEIFKACFWHFHVLLSFRSFCSYLTCFWPLYHLFPLGLFWWYNKVAELHYSLITCMCSTKTGRHNIRQQTSRQRTLTEANEVHLP